MKKTSLLALGLISLVSLTSCGGTPVDEVAAKKILETVNEKAPETIKSVEQFTAISKIKMDFGTGSVQNKDMTTKVVVSTVENYFCNEIRIGDDITTATYIWYDEGQLHTFDFVSQNLTKVPMKEELVKKEIKEMIDQNIENQLAGTLEALSGLVDVDESKIIDIQKENYGVSANVKIEKFVKSMVSKNDLSLLTEITGNYSTTIEEAGSSVSVATHEYGKVEVRDGLPMCIITNSESETKTTANGETKSVKVAVDIQSTFDYGNVEVTIPQVQE